MEPDIITARYGKDKSKMVIFLKKMPHLSGGAV